MKTTTRIRSPPLITCLVLVATLIVVSNASPASTMTMMTHASAASSSDFASTNSTITSAFVATRGAEQSGGNVTGLVAKLNDALALFQKAQAENATNPAQATADLQNSTQIAEQVSASAAVIAKEGSSSRQIKYAESIGASIAIVVLASLVYIYGARIYHLIWFYLYRNHMVRSGSTNNG